MNLTWFALAWMTACVWAFRKLLHAAIPTTGLKTTEWPPMLWPLRKSLVRIETSVTRVCSHSLSGLC